MCFGTAVSDDKYYILSGKRAGEIHLSPPRSNLKDQGELLMHPEVPALSVLRGLGAVVVFDDVQGPTSSVLMSRLNRREN